MDRSSIEALEGVVPILPTPLTADRAVDDAGVAHLVGFCADQGMDGVVVLGSNGEYPYLSAGERRRVMAVATEAADGRLPVIGTASAAGTDEAVAGARVAAEVGCDAVMAAIPTYFAIDADEARDHMAAIAEVGLPVFFYHFPEVTGLVLTPGEIGRVAALEGVVGAKVTVVNEPFLRAVIEETAPRGWRVFTGSSLLLASCVAAGGAGVFCPIPLLGPHAVRAVWEAARRGDHDHATELQSGLTASIPLMSGIDVPVDLLAAGFEAAVTQDYAGPGDRPRPTHNLLKAALRLAGHPIGEEVKRPCRPVTDDQRDLLARTLADLGWAEPGGRGGAPLA